MIVPELMLREIFSQLPPHIGVDTVAKPIRYEWGSQEDLIAWLKNISGNKYPLIWLVQGKQTNYNRNHYTERRCRFIIANLSKNTADRNPTVFDSDFENVINPVYANVIKCLEKSGVTSIINDGQIEEERVANYTEEDLTKSTDAWNVIVIDINVRFKEKVTGEPLCINSNIFNNE